MTENKVFEDFILLNFDIWFYDRLFDLLQFYKMPDMKIYQFGEYVIAAFCSELFLKFCVVLLQYMITDNL